MSDIIPSREDWEITNISNTGGGLGQTFHFIDIPTHISLAPGETVDFITGNNTPGDIAASLTVRNLLISSLISTTGYLHTHDDKADVDHTHIEFITLSDEITIISTSVAQLPTFQTITDLTASITSTLEEYVKKDGSITQLLDITSAGAIIEASVLLAHAETHTIESHTDTTATGANLNTLTDGSNADCLHTHSLSGGGKTRVHNELTGIQGGVSNEYYHFTSAMYSEVTTFFGNTDITAAEAEILTDGSNADSLHSHANLGGIHNDLLGLQGGTSINPSLPEEYYHLDYSEYITLVGGPSSYADDLHTHEGLGGGSFEGDHNDLTGLGGSTDDPSSSSSSSNEYYHFTESMYDRVNTFFLNTDITYEQAETLIDGSNADALHTHTSLGGVHNDLIGLQGGSSMNPSGAEECYYHLDCDEYLTLIGGPSSFADQYHTHDLGGDIILTGFVAHYNEDDGDTGGDCYIPDPSTTSRTISNPNGGEGDPFYIGDWSDDTSHPAVKQGTTFSIDTPTVCLFANDANTDVIVTVYGGSGTTEVIATYSLINISGNTISGPIQGITIEIGNWATNILKYKADIDVDFDLEVIRNLDPSGSFVNGGRFYFTITHVNAGDGNFTYTSPSIFYDIEPETQTISGTSIIENTVTGKWLSGVQYYTTGDTFDLAITDLDWLNANTYPLTSSYLVSVDASEYGINTFYLDGADLTNWDSDDNNMNASYSGAGVAINRSDYRYVGSTANVSGQVFDWSSGNTDATSDDSICVYTRNNSNTRLIEYFDNEDWRCIQTPISKFDSTDAKNSSAWDSTNLLGASDVQYGVAAHIGSTSAGCFRPGFDYEGYAPGRNNPSNIDGDPDYSSSADVTVYLIREFQHDGSSSGQGNLDIIVASGSITTLEMKLGEARDSTIYGGTQWVDMMVSYDSGLWDFGIEGAGCKTTIVGNTYYWTIGNLNMVYIPNGTVYVRVGIQSGTRITGMTMTFS